MKRKCKSGVALWSGGGGDSVLLYNLFICFTLKCSYGINLLTKTN